MLIFLDGGGLSLHFCGFGSPSSENTRLGLLTGHRTLGVTGPFSRTLVKGVLDC